MMPAGEPGTARPDDVAPTLPVLRSLFSPDALRIEVERAYGVGDVRRCALLRSLTNDVYAVSTTTGPYLLKVYTRARSFGEVAWEIELLAHLAAKGLTVPAAIKRVDGGVIGTLVAPEGARHAALFTWAEGRKPAGPSASLYRAFGRLIARFHAATDDFSSQQSRPSLDVAAFLDPSLAVVLPHLADRPADRDFVAGLAERVRERLASLAVRGLDWGVCHGDVSLDNLHVTDDRRLILFDFGSAGPGWRASDPYGVMTWLTRGKPACWQAFLDGYQEVRPLGRADREALPWFVPVRLLDNLRWHLSDWLLQRGTLALDEDYLDGELAALRAWDQEVLRGIAAH